MTTRIALVHERFTDIAGSEHVVAQMARVWPGAGIHVPFARPEGIPAGLGGRTVVGPLDRVDRLLGRRSYAPLLPAVPWALRRAAVEPGEVDAMVISHHAFAIAAAGAADVPAVAYVHSPARWAWERGFRRGEADGIGGRAALAVLAARARANERRWAPRLAGVVANSTVVRDRIRRWWDRDATVIHPPVDTGYFTPDGTKGDYFVVVGRLVPYKRVDLAVAAAVRAGVRLLVVGSGRDEARCRARGGPGVEFLGRLPRDEMRAILRGARAFLMPGEEDFGIVCVEAMAAGTPVIARGRGGALDTVVPGVGGILVDADDDEDVIIGMAEAMREFDDSSLPPAGLADYASRFSEAAFRARISGVVGGFVGGAGGSGHEDSGGSGH